jgi:integrase
VHSNGKAHYKMDLDRKIKAACKKAKVDPCNFHDLRHTFNTNMLKAGVDQMVIMKMTGHKTMEMFIRYHHMDNEQADNAMDRYNSYLLQNGGSSKEKGKQVVNDDA